MNLFWSQSIQRSRPRKAKLTQSVHTRIESLENRVVLTDPPYPMYPPYMYPPTVPSPPSGWEDAAKAKAASVFNALRPMASELLGEVGTDGDDFAVDTDTLANNIRGKADGLATRLKSGLTVDPPWVIPVDTTDSTFGIKSAVKELAGGAELRALNGLSSLSVLGANVSALPKSGVNDYSDLNNWMWNATIDTENQQAGTRFTFNASGDFSGNGGYGSVTLVAPTTRISAFGMGTTANLFGGASFDRVERDANDNIIKELHANGANLFSANPTYQFQGSSLFGNRNISLSGSRDYFGVKQYSGTGRFIGQAFGGDTHLDLSGRKLLNPLISSNYFWSGDAKFGFSTENAGFDGRVFLSNQQDQFSFSSAAHVKKDKNFAFISVAGGPLGGLGRFAMVEDKFGDLSRTITTQLEGLGEDGVPISSTVIGFDSSKLGAVTKNVNVAVGVIVPSPSPYYQMMIGYQFFAPNPLDSTGHFADELKHGSLFIQLYQNTTNP